MGRFSRHTHLGSAQVPMNSPERQFACDIVTRLRDAGFEALWAGGCVRDELLGLTPKDYDVATSATPDDVIGLFGKRKTIAVGASFGVVMVLGPSKQHGQIEVATFRSDGEYLDGRRPSSVKFCSAKEDAQRRDFTVNGMFYDPTSNEVIDYVNGRRDLEARLIRAIGEPQQRFTEDKLRILRAVRFAATYEFELDTATADAISLLRDELDVVSVERISHELRRMLSHPTRDRSVRWLFQLGLTERLPGLRDIRWPSDTVNLLDTLRDLKLARFETGLATLMNPSLNWKSADNNSVAARCRKLKLSNDETKCVEWLSKNLAAAAAGEALPLHQLKPMLADKRSDLLLDLLAASGHQSAAHEIHGYRDRTPPEQLNPAPLVSGQDLMSLGQTPGPEFKRILTRLREEQLDERIESKDEALQLARQLLSET